MKWRDQSKYAGLKMLWNAARRRDQGNRFLRMAGVPDVAAARTLWKDPTAEVRRRCLAERANGLLGKHGPSWLAEGVEDDDSPLGSARRHGTRDADRRRKAESRMRENEEATETMRQLEAGSIAAVLALLQDASMAFERRITGAAILGGLRCRNAVHTLIEALAEGKSNLTWTCMRALLDIRSRRGARRLMQIVRGKYLRPARQQAINTLWQLDELRAEPLFLHICAAVETEEEYTRDMTT